MTYIEELWKPYYREQELIENEKRERDRQIGMRYMYCECGRKCGWSQYGRDDYCPKCGKWLEWG